VWHLACTDTRYPHFPGTCASPVEETLSRSRSSECCRQSKEEELAEGRRRLGLIQQDLHTVAGLPMRAIPSAAPGALPQSTQIGAQNGDGMPFSTRA
jgi:hypothetical protein